MWFCKSTIQSYVVYLLVNELLLSYVPTFAFSCLRFSGATGTTISSRYGRPRQRRRRRRLLPISRVSFFVIFLLACFLSFMQPISLSLDLKQSIHCCANSWGQILCDEAPQGLAYCNLLSAITILVTLDETTGSSVFELTFPTFKQALNNPTSFVRLFILTILSNNLMRLIPLFTVACYLLIAILIYSCSIIQRKRSAQRKVIMLILLFPVNEFIAGQFWVFCMNSNAS